MSRSRDWVFTLNNYSTTDISWPAGVRYAIWQAEIGADGHTPHLQGYFSMEGPRTLAATKAYCADLARAHLEKRRGTPDEARAYCRKEDTRTAGPWEHGTFTGIGQGSRSDLAAVTTAILDEKRTLKEVATEFPSTYVKYHRGIEKLVALAIEDRSWKTQVTVVYGKPGFGKTYFAMHEHEELEVFRCHPNSTWFDGYTGQQVAVLDDYTGWFGYSTLLDLMDAYPTLVPVKGAYVPWVVRYLYITCNGNPETWYTYGRHEDQQALVRRVENWLVFTAFKEFTICNSWKHFQEKVEEQENKVLY